MRLDDLDPSSNARDLGRGGGGFGGFGGGGGGGSGLGGLLFSLLPMLLGRRLGCGTLAIIAIAGFFLMNSGFLGGGSSSSPTVGFEQPGSVPATRTDAQGRPQFNDAEKDWSARVLRSTELTWSRLFQEQGAQYRPATLNFFSDRTNSGCGSAQSAMGPFYCPADQGVYVDVTFFRELEQRFGAQGDFAKAYVIAHEVGHHVQNITGVASQVRQAQARASQADSNRLQVAMELQADCYAGVWAARNADRLEPGDVEEGLRAAHAIGDDTLAQRAGQRPIESMFTHGTSEQRMAWLKRGLQSGDPSRCDTFGQGA